jgi:hypothetical protein
MNPLNEDENNHAVGDRYKHLSEIDRTVLVESCMRKYTQLVLNPLNDRKPVELV